MGSNAASAAAPAGYEPLYGEKTSGRIRVLHTLPDLIVGGGQHLLLRNIKGMDPSRVQNYVCCIHAYGPMEEAYKSLGLHLLCLNVKGGRDMIRGARALAAFIKREKIDVVHTNNTVADRTIGQLAAKWAKVPVVNSLHSEHESTKNINKAGLKSLPRRLKRGIGIWLAKKTVKHVVPVSGSVKESWEPYLRAMGIGEDKITVVHPGLAPERFSVPSDAERAALKKALGIESDGPILINIGRLNYGKGQHWLVPMMKPVREKFPKARLILVGDGQDRQVLTDSIRHHGLESVVSMLGQRSDITQLLSVADLFVFPSLTEGFPLAVLEAMAAGKAIAAFRLPSFRECVEEGKSGVLVPIGEAEALTKVVLDLLAEPEKIRAFGTRSREIASKFTQESTSSALVRIYESVMK